MGIWDTRDASLAATRVELKAEAGTIERCLELLAECARELEKAPNPSPFSRVAALAVIKTRNLVLASYSVSLDALAQEAGALLRPLIESVELLAYVRTDQTRVEEVLDGKLPSAGARAKAIDGRFKEWRDYLNSHSSHFGMTPESVRHLFDSKDLSLRVVQPFSAPVLRENLRSLFAVSYIGLTEAVLAVDAATPGRAQSLAARADALRQDGMRLFRDPDQSGSQRAG